MAKFGNTFNMHTPEMIDYRLGIDRELVPDYARLQLAKFLSILPKDVIDFIISNYVFVSLSEGENGSFNHFNSIYYHDKAGFILLGETLWSKDSIQKAFTIAHEVAHAFRNHVVKDENDMEPDRYDKREEDADKLAVDWLSRHYKKEDLLKLCHSKYKIKYNKMD